MLTLTCCQDHILTENIWFVCSETSYSGDERRCYRCGTNDKRRTTEDRATQPMEAGGWVSQLLPKLAYIHGNVSHTDLEEVAQTYLCNQWLWHLVSCPERKVGVGILNVNSCLRLWMWKPNQTRGNQTIPGQRNFKQTRHEYTNT